MSDSDEFEVEGAHDALREFLPDSFGKSSRGTDVAAQIERTRRVPLKQPAEKKKKDKDDDEEEDDDDDDDNDDDDEDEDEDEDEFPVTHELIFKSHEKAITTIAVDPSGGRFITGSMDCTIKFHDFASMAPNTLRAFKSVDPWQAKPSANAESHAIHQLQFSPQSGGAFLCITAHPQAKIMSRDGEVWTEFVKGDMYLRDMNNTKGHISEIVTGTWHPSDKNICLTAGTDSTLRIWDINNKRSQKEVIVFKSKAAGSAGRSRMTTAAWASQAQGGNNIIVSTALDGTLVMWGGNGPFTRPTAEVKDAHKPGTWTSGLDISPDGRMVVTRGGDDLVKLWDTRKLSQAMVTVSHPSTADRFPSTNIKYAPDGASITTGSATGHLHILNSGNLRPEHVAEITPGSAIITVDWHPKLNQIFTGSANGETRVLYTPTKSSRGALDIMSRAPKKRHFDDDSSRTMDQSLGISGDAIITPGALQAERRRAAGKNARQPQAQQRTPFMRTQPDEKHVEQNIPLARMLHEDPREALLKYADIAKEDPMFTGAWKETQPVTEYAELSDEEEGPDKKKAKR